MTIEDRWMLPDGVEELLPSEARAVENLRRRLLDVYDSWGYELVIPPLMEFTDSLLIGLSADVDLQTFKVIDQLSGRTMGIRADITPQTARIDAHSLAQEGATRLCYAGSVLHTKAKSLLSSRSPIQLGAELFGVASTDADIEIITLMLETVRVAGVDNAFIELGHVGIFKALSQLAGLDEAQEQTLFDALQRKATAEINQQIGLIADKQAATMLRELAALHGDLSTLVNARQVLKEAPASIQKALDELDEVAANVMQRMPAVKIHIDLSELRGYSYHTGVVFAAYASGYGQAIAKGGRYDDIGQVFGRERPATGFDSDLKALVQLGEINSHSKPGIFVPSIDSHDVWERIQTLRSEGERVVCGLEGQLVRLDELNCDRQLIVENKVLIVKPL